MSAWCFLFLSLSFAICLLSLVLPLALLLLLLLVPSFLLIAFWLFSICMLHCFFENKSRCHYYYYYYYYLLLLFLVIIIIIPSSSIARWSAIVYTLPSALASFVRKALQQQLPTFANLTKWGKSTTNLCPLCWGIQTNKHVLNNCSSTAALDRYRARHDGVLTKFCNWLMISKRSNIKLFADLNLNFGLSSTNELFCKYRPDVALMSDSGVIYIVELTICHETNINKSMEFKREKYTY